MFGFIYLLFNTVGLTVGYIKNDITDNRLKDHAEKLYKNGKNPAHTYIDSQGCERDLSTNHKVYTYRDKNRDLIIEDLKTGKKINVDKPIREEKYIREKNDAIQEAKNNKGIAQFGYFSEKEYKKSFLYYKDRYIDVNGNIYIKKYMIWNSDTMSLFESNRIGAFYLNIKTNKIDYIDIISPGKIFKHCFAINPPYQSYEMIYANKKESEKYKEWYNNYLSETKDNPLKYYGKFSKLDYKKI